jgi:hypothetical protein
MIETVYFVQVARYSHKRQALEVMMRKACEVDSTSNRNEYQKLLVVPKADNLTAIYEPIV